MSTSNSTDNNQLYNKYGLKLSLVQNNVDLYPQIGQLIDTYDEFFQLWSVAQIIDIKDDQIKIDWYGWNSSHDKWINKNDTSKLAPLHTHTFPMKPLSKPPYINDNIKHQSSVHESYITIKNHTYNTKTNTWSDYILPNISSYVCAIDHENNRIFYVQLHGIVYTFNLNTNKLKKHSTDKPFTMNFNAICEFIDNKLHVFDSVGDRRVYDINTKQWKLFLNQNHFVINRMIYIKSKKIFIGFGHDFSHDCFIKAFYCKYNTDSWIEYKALLSTDINLNHLCIKDVCNLFDHLLLIRFADNAFGSIIMWFDLDKSKWFKCDKNYPVQGKTTITVNTMDNYLHFISCRSERIDDRTHYKINVIDMIPLELDEFYRNDKYNKLIFGYIKQMQ
eukprot:320669_1